MKSWILILIAAFSAFSQQKGAKAPSGSQSDSRGEAQSEVPAEEGTGTTLQYHLYSVDAPVITFALSGDIAWCATESTVVSVPLQGGVKTPYAKLGTMPASGLDAIVADRQGRVWFGGRNGVASKSGSKFVVFNRDNGLPGNLVLSMAASDDGSVWAGTDSGLCRFRGDTMSRFTSKDGLPSNRIQALTAAGKGTLWVGTDRGIAVLTGTGWKTYTTVDGMSSDDIRALAWDSHKGTLWAAVGEKDVNTFDGRKWGVFMDIQSGITTIMIDSQGRVWFGTGMGVWKFNGDTWENEMAPFGIPMKHVYQMSCEEKGNLWFATERGLIYLPDPYPF